MRIQTNGHFKTAWERHANIRNLRWVLKKWVRKKRKMRISFRGTDTEEYSALVWSQFRWTSEIMMPMPDDAVMWWALYIKPKFWNLTEGNWFSSVSSVAQSCPCQLWPHGLQHARPPCPSPTPGASSNACPSSRWCHPTVLSSVPYPSCLPSSPAPRSFPVRQFLPLSGQSIGVSASSSVLQMNIQDWFPLGLTGLISLKSKGLLRVFSNTTVQKHQFFSAQPNSHIHTWPQEKP